MILYLKTTHASGTWIPNTKYSGFLYGKDRYTKSQTDSPAGGYKSMREDSRLRRESCHLKHTATAVDGATDKQKEHRLQLRNKAVGVDRITKDEYNKNLDANLDNLLKRMKTFSYRPQAVKRVYIPKANGKLRPLGIPSYEDKLVQGVLAKVLNGVYEPRFLDCSYGFRPDRSAHDAIKAIRDIINKRPIGWVVEADIKGGFDNMSHEWIIEFLKNDIADENFIRYIIRFLKAGIMDKGIMQESTLGAPQGGLISPYIANVYLHYVLDLWFEKVVKKHVKGKP